MWGNGMRKNFLAGVLFAAVLLFSAACAPGVKPPQDAGEGIDYSNTLSLLPDSSFQSGFTMTGYDSRYQENWNIGSLTYEDTAVGTPYWRIGQWGCNKNLIDAEYRRQDGTDEYYDGSKTLRVNRETGAFSLNLDASEDYTAPRKDGEPWIHYILEVVSLPKKARLGKIDKLYFNLDFTLNKSECKMEQPDPGLHSAILLWYITLRDNDPDSPGYGDYYWFGLPYYDTRYDYSKEHAAQDSGKEDRTNAFIYNPAGEKFLQEKVTVGKKMTISTDVMPLIVYGYNIARERGFLRNSKFNDLVVASTYIGWEAPGTYDVGVDITKFEMLAVPFGTEEK